MNLANYLLQVIADMQAESARGKALTVKPDREWTEEEVRVQVKEFYRQLIELQHKGEEI